MFQNFNHEIRIPKLFRFPISEDPLMGLTKVGDRVEFYIRSPISGIAQNLVNIDLEPNRAMFADQIGDLLVEKLKSSPRSLFNPNAE